jgi:outer membrane protein
VKQFLCLLLLSTFARADIYQMEPEEARTRLLEHNRGYQQSLLAREDARLNILEAGSRALPTLSLDAQGTRLGNRSSFTFQNDDPSAADQVLMTAAKDNYAWGLHANQILFSGSVFYAIGVARSYDAVAEAQLELDRIQILQHFIQSYAQMEMLADLRSLSSDHLEQIKLRYDDATLLSEIGQLSRYDLLRSEVEYLNTIPQLREAENALTQCDGALTLMLGLETGTQIKTWPIQLYNEDLALEFPRLLQGEGNLETLFAHAALKRPDFRLTEKAIEGYERAVKVYGSERLPTVAAFANWERKNQWDLFAQDDAFANSWNTGLSLSIPLFTGFRTHSQVQKGKLDLKGARLQKSELHDAVALEIETTLGEVHRLHANTTALEHAVKVAKESLSIARTLRQLGESSELELRDARLASKAARMHLAEGRFQLIVAQTALLVSVGELEETQLQLRPTQLKEVK